MKYSHIAQYVSETPWAILPAKMSELLAVLAHRAAGHEFTPEEIQARIGEGGGSPAASTRGSVAVIPIRGVIAHRMGSMDDSSGGTSCERIGAMLAQVMADDSVGTIVFDVDSPGGAVTGMAELAAKIYEARATKQIIAVANGMMASAAYELGSQAHEIVAIPSGQVGSIGVFSVHQDLSAALEKEGIDVTVFSAGKFKTEGLPFTALSDEAKAFRQASVDAAYAGFVKDVARGRGVAVGAVRDGYGQGRALGAKEALKAGLIDRIGTLEQTIGKALGSKAGAGLRADASEVEPPAEMTEAELAAMHAAAASVVNQAVDDLRARRRRLL